MRTVNIHEDLKKVLGPFQLWGIAVGLVISGEYFGWSYGWATAGTLGFLVATVLVATMYTTFIFSFTELSTAIPHAGGPFAYARRAFGPTGGFVAGFATLIEFVFAPPAIALAIGAYLNVQFPAINPKWFALGAYVSSSALNWIGVGIAAAFELFVTVLAIFELLVFMGVVAPGWSMANFVPTAGLAAGRAQCRGHLRHLRVDSLRDLVLPGDRRRGHGGRRGARPAPHHSHRLHHRHRHAGGAGLRRDGLRGRRGRLAASWPTSTTRCRRR
jgi:amino acid transporter